MAPRGITEPRGLRPATRLLALAGAFGWAAWVACATASGATASTRSTTDRAHGAGAPITAEDATRAADTAVLEARKAFFAGDAARLAQRARAAAGSVLAAYPEMWQLSLALRAGQGDEAAVHAFLERHAGEVVADRLRREWVVSLAAHGDYARFAQERARLPAGIEDAPFACYESLARYALVPEEARESIALDARRLLASSPDPASDACSALADRLIDDGRLDPWARLQALLERYQFPAVRRVAAARLPAPVAASLQRALDRPERWLTDNADTLAPEQRGLALLALVLLSREQADVAAQWADRIGPRLDEPRRAAAWGRIGHMGQLSRMDDADAWFARAGDGLARGPDYVRAAEVLESRARARITRAAAGGCPRAPLAAGEARERWAGLSDAIDHLAPERRSDPTWTYWQACARMALGQPEDARALWKSIADRQGFHGRLAAEELGQPLFLPPAPDAPREEDIARLAPLAPFERARHFLALGLREEGNREWSAGLRGLDDRGLLAAAELASRMGLVDRMIASSESTRSLVDMGTRFPAPYRDRMNAITGALQLEPSWVYGLIRQESRFIEGVHSAAGAVGLMQLMPATASYVARRIGMPQAGSAAQHLGDTDVNLRLGSEYLRLVLDDQDGQKLLATAAYNCGPKRVRKWRSALAAPVDGAAFVDTIPIPETRDYVRKVLYNAVVYRALLDEPAANLHALLGTVTPHEPVENDLP